MLERLPWEGRYRLGAVVVVLAAWLIAMGTYRVGHPTTWVWLGLAAWLTVGLVYRVSEGERDDT